MSFTIVQILLLTAYSMYNIYDELQMNSSLSQPVWAGMISGLIMGDMKTGLIIGAALQLTVLGVGTFGGASKIDANSGTVLATAFSIGTGMKAATAIAAIGVPVAALLTSFDILADLLIHISSTKLIRILKTSITKVLKDIQSWVLCHGAYHVVFLYF